MTETGDATLSANGGTDPRLILLAPDDNVLVVGRRLAAGETVAIEGRPVAVDRDLPLGHKMARRPIEAGAAVLKYGAPIGRTTEPIPVGAHVHTHNVESAYTPTYTLDQFKPETEAS